MKLTNHILITFIEDISPSPPLPLQILTKNLNLSIFSPLPLHIIIEKISLCSLKSFCRKDTLETTMIREETWFSSAWERAPCCGSTIKE